MTVKQKIFQVMDSPTVSVELHGQSGGGGVAFLRTILYLMKIILLLTRRIIPFNS
jgi:hypothetical protein